MKIAIVGSGPAGFYAAGQLLNGADVSIDMIDRLPTPWGLVRAGVAPDHPKIKTVTRVFEKIAANPRFRFFGGVEFGRDVTRAELTERYHAVIYATGTAADRPLGIPGGELSRPATAFVGWYNGHPDFADEQFDLSHERAVVIGNGNVALDVARMLRAAGGGPAASRTRPTTRSRPSRRSSVQEVVVRRPPRRRAGRVHEPRAARAGRRLRRRRRPGRAERRGPQRRSCCASTRRGR